MMLIAGKKDLKSKKKNDIFCRAQSGYDMVVYTFGFK